MKFENFEQLIRHIYRNIMQDDYDRYLEIAYGEEEIIITVFENRIPIRVHFDDVIFPDFDDELLEHLIKMDDTNSRGIGKGLQEKDVEEIIRRFGRKKDFKDIER